MMMAEFEAMDRMMMTDLADLYDTDVPISENEPFKARFREMQNEWEHELKGRMGVTRPDES
jgi:hypothetical protein